MRPPSGDSWPCLQNLANTCTCPLSFIWLRAKSSCSDEVPYRYLKLLIPHLTDPIFVFLRLAPCARCHGILLGGCFCFFRGPPFYFNKKFSYSFRTTYSTYRTTLFLSFGPLEMLIVKGSNRRESP